VTVNVHLYNLYGHQSIDLTLFQEISAKNFELWKTRMTQFTEGEMELSSPLPFAVWVSQFRYFYIAKLSDDVQLADFPE